MFSPITTVPKITETQKAASVGSFFGRFLGRSVSPAAASAASQGTKRSLGDRGYGLLKLLAQGNEYEGLETGARIFTGYDPGLFQGLGMGLAFDAARPGLKRGIQKLDGVLSSRYGQGGAYGRLRSDLGGIHQKFKQVSKFAPAANVLGGIQQGAIGFNQFDPAYSIEEGKRQTLDSVAGSLGWNDAGSMRADMEQMQPVIRGVRSTVNALSSGANRLRYGAVQNRLDQLPEAELQSSVNQALGNYGPSFLDRSVYDQAAIIDSLNRRSMRQRAG